MGTSNGTIGIWLEKLSWIQTGAPQLKKYCLRQNCSQTGNKKWQYITLKKWRYNALSKLEQRILGQASVLKTEKIFWFVNRFSSLQSFEQECEKMISEWPWRFTRFWNGPFTASFSFIFVYGFIWTADLWEWNQPLCQLSHNPKFNMFSLNIGLFVLFSIHW